MRLVERSEILPIGEYELIRPHFRARIIEEKRHRRVKLGEVMSAVFENHDSALLQIQEMLRTERITSESNIQHEIDTYNELVPGERELSLTLFVEIPDANVRNAMLIELRGLEKHVSIEVDGVVFPLKSDHKGVMDDRTTAVHYFKTQLSEEAAGAVRAKAAKVAVRVDHPRYVARADLGPASIAKLADDLS